ncbi:MAG: hypothetical protein QXO21_00445 [Candidatus Anstonellales archaeon]
MQVEIIQQLKRYWEKNHNVIRVLLILIAIPLLVYVYSNAYKNNCPCSANDQGNYSNALNNANLSAENSQHIKFTNSSNNNSESVAINATVSNLSTNSTNIDNIYEFKKCINESGWQLFVLKTCPHCQNQKARFNNSLDPIVVIECSENSDLCSQNNIRAVPTWKNVFTNKTFMGDQPLSNLVSITGCQLS